MPDARPAAGESTFSCKSMSCALAQSFEQARLRCPWVRDCERPDRCQYPTCGCPDAAAAAKGKGRPRRAQGAGRAGARESGRPEDGGV